MSVECVFSCEVCGHKKGTGNRWWLGMTANLKDGSQMVSLYRWNDGLARNGSTHLCGQTCALVWTARMMDEHAIEHVAMGELRIVH